ncbi:hypothetical protein B0T25DRAFT_520405 [Lasiosphaeria hispida]|uniref:Uncharacterized protein n=1 Tax=Lasiosphaeria hispida TaxID=260671 RepID=A0AAJ0MA68_9PEZI|nr:hypothetical protein B0T25DRAFT_520405 [Lasiosphaeria hispida]
MAYFPRTERRHTRPRRCIGHIRYVRLCEHEVLRWASVVEAARKLAMLDPDTQLEEPVRVRLVTCQNPTYLPTHHSFTEKGQPSIIMERSGTGTIQLIMEWVGHMNLAQRTTDRGKRLGSTPTEIAHQLQHFRRRAPAEFIAPQSAPGYLPEMKCFDPSRCCCLTGGTEPATCRFDDATHTSQTTQSYPS